MALKIYLIYLMVSGSYGVDIFGSLYEAQDEGGKATACVSDTAYQTTPRSCPGVLWRQSLLLVRASCLRYVRNPYVLKGITNCTLINATSIKAATKYCDEEMCIRYVTSTYLHPRFPSIDLAILRLDAPFTAHTCAFSEDLEETLNEWENTIFEYYTTTIKETVQIRLYQMYTTPVKMFLATVIFPTVSFILFFLFVIFYTGTSEKKLDKDIPYADLINEEETKRIT